MATESITVETQMLIRKSRQEVFEAFTNPKITTKFWFTKSTGQLVKGQKVRWQWEMYNVSTEVYVEDIIPNELIKIKWDNPSKTVDFEFTSLGSEKTYVTIKNYGFHQSGNELIEAVKDNTGGFTIVLAGLKAYLEHGIQLNLVLDKFPEELMNP